MRVLLLNPPYKTSVQWEQKAFFPLGLAYLGTALKKAGIDVLALDAIGDLPAKIGNGTLRYGLSPHELGQRIKEIKPDMVGIGCISSSRFPAVLEAASIIKGINDNIITATGGIHSSLDPESVCAHQEIDFAILGEGEESFLKLIKAISRKRDFSGIDGLAYKQNGHIAVSPKASYIDNLDSIGFPDWDLFDIKKYARRKEERWGLGKEYHAPVTTSRSCPFRCTFCSIHSVMGPKYRSRSSEHVLDEIEILTTKYGVNEISFEDDNLTYDRERFIRICQGIIDRTLKIKWNAPNGVYIGSLDEKSLMWAKASGCVSLNLPIESGDDFIRNKVIKKGLKREKIYEIVKACRKEGIKTNAYFVIGMPGETEASIANTKKYIRDLKFNNISVFIATPWPGTKLYEECTTKGYISDSLFNNELANYQTNTFAQPSIETPDFDRHKILLWRYSLYISYSKTKLKDSFFRELFNNPRVQLPMITKVILHTVFGNSLSYRLFEGIKAIFKSTKW